MKIKNRIAGGLLALAITVSPMTTTLANQNLDLISVNSKELSEVSEMITNSIEGLENVYILNSENLVDGISGGVLAGENNGTIVLLENGKLSEKAMNIVNSSKMFTQ